MKQQATKSTMPAFQYDLEKEIATNPQRAVEILEKASANIKEIKATLRKGATPAEAKGLDALLKGYESLKETTLLISKKSKES